jgi:hypothetical protein
VTFVSQPLLPLPSQLPQPGLQAGMQAPPVHMVAPFGLTQGMLQPPQLLTLFWMLVSQPLPALPSQLANPGLQPSWHTPPEQLTLPFGLTHSLPQVPQLSTSLFELVSQPLLGLPSQLFQPVLQTGVHAPPTQLVVP